MRRRLLASMLLVATFAVIGFGTPLALAARAVHRDEALLLLSQRAAEAVAFVPSSFAYDGDPPELPATSKAVELALYDAAGRRVLGAGPATADEPVRAALAGRGGQRRRGALVVAVPVTDKESVVGAIRAAAPAAVIDGKIRRSWLEMTALAVAVLAVAGMAAGQRSRRLAAPLALLRDDARLVDTGLEPPARPASGIPEIDTLREELTRAAIRLHRALAHERSFSADVAHQMRTPLTSLRLRLEDEQLQGSAGTHTPAPALLSELLVDVDRLARIVDDLVALARDDRNWSPPQPLATPLREAAERWQPLAQAAHRSLTLQLQDHLPWVRISPAALRQVLDVLLDNALRHGRGRVTLSAVRLGNGAVVAVKDEGPDTLDPAEIFSRRSPTARGTGIGLSLARRLADAEDMRLVLADPGPGPTFHLLISGAAEGPENDS